jgi:tRNA-dihydrouridine synthase
MKEHLELSAAFYGERTAVVLFRKFFAWYTKGIPAKGLKVSAFRAATLHEMTHLIDKVRDLQEDRDRGLTGENETVLAQSEACFQRRARGT